MLNRAGSAVFGTDHEQFRDTVRRFIAAEFTPHLEAFEADGKVSRAFWRAAGKAGLLCLTLPERYGGLELDFSFNAVVNEEFTYAMMSDTLTLQTDITLPYLVNYGSEALKAKVLPKLVSGELITAIAMTEPGAGSDLQSVRTTARRDGGDDVINGSKTYITNGQNADLILTVCKTDPAQGSKGTSLILVEADRAGFERGRNLEKIGQWSADTSELFFEDVRVPVGNLLGEENRGFLYLVSELAQERLSISISAQAAARRSARSTKRSSSSRNARPLASWCSISRTPASASPTWRRGCRSAGRISTGRSPAMCGANCTCWWPPRRSFGTPRRSGCSASRRCSSTAAPGI